MSLYADRHGLDVVALPDRLVPPEPATIRAPGDLALPRRLRADGRGGPDHAGARASPCSTASRTTPARWWDLAPGRALGYDPLDDAEDWADRIEPRPEDAAESAVVGGDFASPSTYGRRSTGPRPSS